MLGVRGVSVSGTLGAVTWSEITTISCPVSASVLVVSSVVSEVMWSAIDDAIQCVEVTSTFGDLVVSCESVITLPTHNSFGPHTVWLSPVAHAHCLADRTAVTLEVFIPEAYPGTAMIVPDPATESAALFAAFSLT